MVAVVVAATVLVVTVKVAEVVPARMRTEAGTVAPAMLLDSPTAVPPDGAVPFRVTVPVELATPPITVVGLRLTDCTAVARGLTVKVAVVELPYVAVIVGVDVAVTEVVVTANVADVAPCNTFTVAAGTAATAGLLLDKFTVIPLVGAAAFN
jgi:hypothetical protein